MKVKELIALLFKCPASDLIYVEDKALEQSASIDDVTIGRGTLSGHSYISVNVGDWQEERKQIEIYEKLLARAAYMLDISIQKKVYFPDIEMRREAEKLENEIRTALEKGESIK